MAMIMEVVVVMGMGMVVGMAVGVLMGMGNAVMGVFVGMGVGMLVVMSTAGHMVVMDVHGKSSLGIFLLLYSYTSVLSKYLFLYQYPPLGLAHTVKIRYNALYNDKERSRIMSEHTHEHDHAYLHAHGIAHTHGHVHENQRAVVNRLSRAIGHLEKVKRMVEEGYDCSEVLIQLAAVRSALDNTGKVILKDHMRHCMVDAVAAGDQDAIDDLCQAIDKFMK